MSKRKQRILFVLSFNRPDYLRRTLRSLRCQTDRNWQICLFQDGPRPCHWLADSAAAQECVVSFQRCFPDGRVFQSPENIGIARNMLAAQQFAFERLRLDTAYFFEDDMVLHRRYMEQLFLLETALSHIKHIVPYFAAYGDLFTRTVPPSTRITNDLSIMDHLWGFGLFREHWEEEQQVMAPYFDYIQSIPYRDRNHRHIRQLFQRLGVPLAITSQDGARAVALCVLRRAAIRTRRPMANYIGEQGTHFTPEVYRQWGFGTRRPRFFLRCIRPEIAPEQLPKIASCYRRGILDLYPLSRTLSTQEIPRHEQLRCHHTQANRFAA